MASGPPPVGDDGQKDSLHFPHLSWQEWAGMALWIGAIVFCVQFAIASAQELEPQASQMGWMLVAILLVGGLAFWGACFQNRPPEDRSTR